MTIRRRAFFSGIVQGIGFRYTVERFASGLQLKGWVRNLPDGRVEMIVEGDKAVVEKLIENIECRYAGQIRGREIFDEPPQGNFKDFEIRLHETQ